MKEPEILSNLLSKRSCYTDLLFKRPKSLSKLLPYDEYYEEKKIFVQKDGSLGAVFEIDLLEHESEQAKDIISKLSDLKNWMRLSEQFVLQVYFDQSKLSTLDKKWKNLEDSFKGGNEVSKYLYKEKIKSFKKNSNYPYVRKCYLSVRYFPKQKSSFSLLSLKSKGNKELKAETVNFIREAKKFDESLKVLELDSGLKLKRLEADNLVDFLRKFFNPKTYYKRPFANYAANSPISEQVIFNFPTLDYSGIEREGLKTKTISVKAPQFTYPGAPAYFLELDFPFSLNLNFSFPPKNKIEKFLGLKSFFLENTPSAYAKIQKEEIDDVQEKIARGDSCVHLTISVVIEGESDDELEEKIRRVVSVFHNKFDCEVIVEDDIGLGLCLNTLPLNYTPDADLSSSRYFKILASDACSFLPIFDSFKGFKNPISLHLSRENNLVPFSLLENETSNHTVILADSGSGKSCFVNDWICSVKKAFPKEKEPLVFVVDKGSSYTALAEYFDSDVTVFDRNKDIPFSPFRGVFDEEKISFLTNFILLAIKLSSETFSIESEHRSAITKALREAYKTKSIQNNAQYVDGEIVNDEELGEIEINMDDFIDALSGLTEGQSEGFRELIRSLAEKLRPFYGDGIYAKFFKGSLKQNHPGEEKLFYIYDLDSIESDKILQSLLTMAVTEEIRRIIRLPQNRGRTSFVVFEEFAMLGRNNPMMRDFAIDMAERMRKLGCWIIALTPRPQNYFDLEVGQAFWGVADNFIFLRMSPENVDFLAKNSNMFNEADIQILNSLELKKGSHTDVYYFNKNKRKKGAFKSVQTPFDRWLAPTNAKDAHLLSKTLGKFKHDKWKTLEYLVQKFPEGA